MASPSNSGCVVEKENQAVEVKTQTEQKHSVVVRTPKRALKRKFDNIAEDEGKTESGKPSEETQGEEKQQELKQNVLPYKKRQRIEGKEISLPPLTFTGPVKWTVDAVSDGKALFVDDEKIIIGTRDHRVIFISHEGKFIRQHQLNNPVSTIFQDEGFLYAWCHTRLPVPGVKGSLYDITNNTPAKLLDISNFGEVVLHACMVEGCLALGDNKGRLAFLGCDGRVLWAREQDCPGDGGLFLGDSTGLYVAHKKKLVKYDLKDGEVVWEFHVTGTGRQDAIQTGAETSDSLFIEAGGQVQEVSKETGFLMRQYQPDRHRTCGVVVGNGVLITGECPTIIFDIESGKELHRMILSTRLKDAVSLLDGSRHLLIFWDKLYDIDLTPHGIVRAVSGTSTRTMEYTIPEVTDVDKQELADTKLASTGLACDGTMVKCVQEEDEIRVLPVADVYNVSWPVAFPINLRVPGFKYMVDALVPAERGEYYRYKGNIKHFGVTKTAAPNCLHDGNVDDAAVESCTGQPDMGENASTEPESEAASCNGEGRADKETEDAA